MNSKASIDSELKKMNKEDSSFWEKVQREQSLNIFQKASRMVPAYKVFIEQNNINPNGIVKYEDFLSLPTISKSNYLKVFPRQDLLYHNISLPPSVFTSTSGSTGKPFYFLRNYLVDLRCSVLMEEFIRQGNKKMPNTLVIVCFGMGVWIGGLITFRAFDMLSRRNNFPISIITPGINKKEIIGILEELTDEYDQIVFAGYPPLIKDIIDESERLQLPFLLTKKIKIKFAAEAISEGLREYLAVKTNMKNMYIDTVNVYGSADIGAMAVESTTSILIKKLLQSNKKAFKDIFTITNKIPTLAQYNPNFVSFEAVNGNVLLTSDNILPLIRYEIGDRGGVFSYDELEKKLQNYGIDIRSEARKLKIDEYISKQPFVYIYERDDLSTTLYGLSIYPEWIRNAMYHATPQKHITGKFTIITQFDKGNNQYLELNIELKKDGAVSEELMYLIKNLVIASLKESSSEYCELVNHVKERAHPRIKFWPYEDLLHFQPGIKQKWVK